MCGIGGFTWLGGRLRDVEAVAQEIANSISHRGPDDSGVWIDELTGVAMVHRRLSILDLTPAGHQPMVSRCERYVLVFNGEIYNHYELRRMLAGSELCLSDSERVASAAWRGHSDTETLLAAIEAWGLEKALRQSVGMFAFALWDRSRQELFLVRDRVGEKPLYYGLQNGAFLFGSEIKTLRAFPAFRGEIDRNALTLYLRHSYIPAPYSIYEGIFKLLPGTFLKVTRQNLRDGRLPAPQEYWSARRIVESPSPGVFKGSDDEAIDELSCLLKSTISNQMIADVPLGAFLSGGVDSSTVVALMQAQASRPVQTFTIGFQEEGFNEAEHAQAVARHLGTEHTELYVTPADALNVIPKLPTIYDEPFADSSQIPTYLISELTRRHVTVSLSGDGGDELFGGYNRYFWAANIWRKFGSAPKLARLSVAAGLKAIRPGVWDGMFKACSPILPGKFKQPNAGDKLHKLAEMLSAQDPEQIYMNLVSHWKEPADVVIGGNELPTVLNDASKWARLPEFERRMMYLDQVSYLPDDILVKVDRAAMAVSLETRIPFLDHRVVEFAWRLPLSMKIRNGEGKWILRQLLYRHVPKKLIERPKMGFGVPIDSWLRGPLRDWAESLLSESRLKQEGFFEPAPIRKKWREHLSGERNWQYYLWDVLMFQAWLDAQRECAGDSVYEARSFGVN